VQTIAKVIGVPEADWRGHCRTAFPEQVALQIGGFRGEQRLSIPPVRHLSNMTLAPIGIHVTVATAVLANGENC